MRIGPVYDAVCANLFLSGGIIQYVHSLKYLGICIKTNRTFVCSFDHVGRYHCHRLRTWIVM